MKILKYLPIVAAALLSFSCQDVEKTYAAPAEEVLNPVLNPHADIVVEEATLSNNVTFTWSEVDYGYPAQVTYSLYAVYGGAELQLGQSFTTSYTMSKEALNNLLVDEKGLALPAGEVSEISLYVTSAISNNVNSAAYTKKSEAITLKITTVAATTAPWIRRYIHVPGNHQGWAPDAAPILWETGEDSFKFEGLVYLVNAENATANVEFKFTQGPNWDVNLGGSMDSMTPGGENIVIEAANSGAYWITVETVEDFSTGSVKLRKVGAVNVIGSAVGGWEVANDLALTCTDVNGQVWSGVCDNCAGGEFKFRLTGGDFEANPWEMNWGGDINHMTVGGDNITTDLTGKVRFTINFRGDIPTLAEDATNPSPIFATVAAE
ncbi:MAG: SusE domain-containing protein [Alistipes sp.]|nr:SusE domain-containing protein [Alistipes sp.]